MVARILPVTLYKGRDAAAEHDGIPCTNGARPDKPMPIKLRFPPGVILHQTSLEMPDDMKIDAWAAIGAQLMQIDKGVQWAFGDWWCYGHHRYGERKEFAKTINAVSYEFGSLMNLGWVARRVPTSLRNEVLSWSHHAAIAQLQPADQKEWLGKAVRHHWTIRELRQALYERERRDLEDEPDAITARKEFARLTRCAELAHQYNFLSDEFSAEPWLDHLCERDVKQCAVVARRARNLWTAISDGLERYLEHRKSQGEAFRPRPVHVRKEPTSTPADEGVPGQSQAVLARIRERRTARNATEMVKA